MMADELKACPLEPTIEMLVAGRKQTFADMTGEHMGPSAENTWKAMWNAAPDTRPLTGGVTAEMVRLVVAARAIAFGGLFDGCGEQQMAAIRELDEASEAFAATVPWTDEP
jgi:hypothetical protein